MSWGSSTSSSCVSHVRICAIVPVLTKSTVYINALSRKKYIGILKGIGIDAQAIQFSYTAQAIFYALCGIGSASILVYAVIKPILDRYPIETPLSNGILVADAGGVIIRALILLVISALAGYVPARLIVRKNTLDAILGR